MRLRFRISRKGVWLETGDPSQGVPPQGLRFLVLAALLLVFCAATAAFFVVLSENGLLVRYFDLNFAFLLTPLLAFNAVVLVGSVLKRLLPGGSGRLAGLLVKGAAFAFVLNAIFHNSLRIEQALVVVPELEEGVRQVFTTLRLATLNSLDTEAVLLVLGYTLTRLPPFPLSLGRVREDVLSACVSSAGLVLIAFVVKQGFSAFATYDPLRDVGTILFAGLLSVALGAALRPFGDAPNPILGGIFQWMGRSQLRNFTFGGFLATYFLVIRPVVFDTLVYALFFEWILVLAIAWRLYAGLRTSIGEAVANVPRPLPYEGWQRHRQRITHTHPEFLAYFTEIQTEFLEESIKHRLLVQVTTALWENGLRQWEVARMVRPLLDYRDAPLPYPRFPWEERWIKRRNRRNRQQLLDSTIALLERFAAEGQRFRLEEVTT